MSDRSAAVGSIATSAFLATTGLLTGAIAARALGPDGRGQLAAFTIWAVAIGGVSILARDQAVVYFGSGNPSRGRSLQRAVWKSLTWPIVVFCIIVVTGLGVSLRDSPGVLVIMAPAAIVAVVASARLQVHLSLTRVLLWFRVWNSVRVLPQLTYAVAVIALASIGLLTSSLAATALTAGIVLAAWIAAVMNSRRPTTGEVELAADDMARVRSYGYSILMVGIPQFLNLRLDQIMIAVIAGQSELGIYVVGVAVAAPVALAGVASEQFLFPLITAGRSARSLMRIVGFLIGLTALGAGLLLLGAPLLIRTVFGMEFLPAAPIARILIIAAGFLALNEIIMAVLKARANFRPMIVAQSAGVAVTVVALPVLYAASGLNGAATASLIAYATTFITLAASLRTVLRRA